MVERQLRTEGVLDARVLAAFQTTKRENFVPSAFQDLAYADSELPLPHDQVMHKPSVQARLIQALHLQATDHVLEVGTGSGYGAAILAQLAHQVTSVEIFEDTFSRAQQKLTETHAHNISLRCRDYAEGPNACVAQYDAILINGALSSLPANFYKALKPHGRIVALLGQGPAFTACLIEQRDGVWQETRLFETNVPYLVNAPLPETFHF